MQKMNVINKTINFKLHQRKLVWTFTKVFKKSYEAKL